MINQQEDNGFFQDKQYNFINNDTLISSGYLTKDSKMIIKSERPANNQLNCKRKIVINKRNQHKLQPNIDQHQYTYSQICQDTSKPFENVKNQSYSQNILEKNHLNNQNLYEITPQKQSKLVQYLQRGLSFSKTRLNQSNDYILTPKSNRSFSTNLSSNSSFNLFQSQISETASTSYLKVQQEKKSFQNGSTCQAIFQTRKQINNKYSELIYHKPINQNTFQFRQKSQNQKNDNLEFGCSNKQQVGQTEENIQEINEQINKQKSENNISICQLQELTLKKNNTDSKSLHKYFQFLLKKPSKVDILKIKELNEINLLLDKKILQSNEKIKSEQLSQRQKQKIQQFQLDYLKKSQKNEIKQFKISINRCLEKLKHQYRTIQSNLKQENNTILEQNISSGYDVINQNQKFSRKISYQDYQNVFIETPAPLKLKKGYSEQHDSVNLKCETPLTAKLEQALEQNIEPKTFSSIRKLNQNILLNNSPIKNIKEKRYKQQLVISQDTTQDFADIVIKKNEIRERKKEEVGELAKYDFSGINRSPCKLKKYASVKIDINQQRFKNIMNNQNIQKQFQDIQNLINNSSTRINKIKNNKQY
ncbi:hypothetical protein ABPG72_007645 [Tetrahymena utriculariae]